MKNKKDDKKVHKSLWNIEVGRPYRPINSSANKHYTRLGSDSAGIVGGMRALRECKEGQPGQRPRTLQNAERPAAQDIQFAALAVKMLGNHKRNTYLLDNGLRECLAHGDEVVELDSAAERLLVVVIWLWWRGRGCGMGN